MQRKVQAVVTPGGSVRVLEPGAQWDGDAAPELQRPPRARRRGGPAGGDTGAAAAKAAQRRRRGRADLRSDDFVVNGEGGARAASGGRGGGGGRRASRGRDRDRDRGAGEGKRDWAQGLRSQAPAAGPEDDYDGGEPRYDPRTGAMEWRAEYAEDWRAGGVLPGGQGGMGMGAGDERQQGLRDYHEDARRSPGARHGGAEGFAPGSARPMPMDDRAYLGRGSSGGMGEDGRGRMGDFEPATGGRGQGSGRQYGDEADYGYGGGPRRQGADLYPAVGGDD